MCVRACVRACACACACVRACVRAWVGMDACVSVCACKREYVYLQITIYNKRANICTSYVRIIQVLCKYLYV